MIKRLLAVQGRIVSRSQIASVRTREIAELKILIAKVLSNQIATLNPLRDLHQAEFKVFSQFGEDGILQYLIRAVQIPDQLRTFVEFGVEDYTEANTRFLLINNNWRGVIIDGSPRHIAKIKQSTIYWRHQLAAIAAFINRENINQLIGNAGFRGDLGILSVDIDGNDYWVWKNIDVVSPVIVVVEYNSIFGSTAAVTVPYDPNFMRARAHYSHLYWGCSLKALELLGRSKGYALIGSNSAGNNAFFVRRDHLNGLLELSAEHAYVKSRFRESRDKRGRLSYLSGDKRQDEIHDMPVVDLLSGQVIRVGDLSP